MATAAAGGRSTRLVPIATNQPRVPEAIFLGFCAKRRTPWPRELAHVAGTNHIIEVANVSIHAGQRPPDWINRWDFNRASCWNTAAAAWACVPAGERGAYGVFAYRAIPLVFDTSGVPYALMPTELFDGMPGGDLPSEPDLSRYVWRGYDIVQFTSYLGHGCSPLVCNGMAEEYAVNQYCLLDQLDVAVHAATAMSTLEPEPSPFIIFEVWDAVVETPSP